MSNDLGTGLILLGAGFTLTTIGGALVGSYLQQRSWTYQWTAQRAVETSALARGIFDEVSRLMDKRLFRLAQLHLWIERGEEELLAVALANYRAVLVEWNDSINRHLSMLQFFFGEEVRAEFDFGVGAHFVAAGTAVERLYRNRHQKDATTENAEAVSKLIKTVRSEVYEFNLTLLSRIPASSVVSPSSFVGFAKALISPGPQGPERTYYRTRSNG